MPGPALGPLLVTLSPLTLTRNIVPSEKEPETLMDLQRPPGSRASVLPHMPWLPEENLSNVSGILGDNLDYCLKHECYEKPSLLSTWKLKSGSQPIWWNTTRSHYDGHGRRRKVVGMGVTAIRGVRYYWCIKAEPQEVHLQPSMSL